MTVLIIHGIGGHAGIHWQQWLNDQLTSKGVTVLMPDMPAADHPDRATWLQTIQTITADIPLNELVIVGHSLGVTTALDFIEQLNSPIHALISVSGFASDYGAELNSYFMQEKMIDFNKVRHNTTKAAVLYGNDDPYVTQAALQEVADELRVTPHVVDGGGHLNTQTGFTEFPLLLDVVTSLL